MTLSTSVRNSSHSVPNSRCVDCGKPDDVDGASIAINGSLCLAVIIYRCLEGYQHRSGNLSRTCQADGVWSGQAPVCTQERNSTSGSGVSPGHVVLGSLGGFCLIFFLLLPLDFIIFMRKRTKRRWARRHAQFTRHRMYVPVRMYGVVRAAIDSGLTTGEVSRDRSPEARRAGVRRMLEDWQPPDIRLSDQRRPKRRQHRSRSNARQVAPLAVATLEGGEETASNSADQREDVEAQCRHTDKRRLPKLGIPVALPRRPVDEKYYVTNELLLDITADPFPRPLPVASTDRGRTRRKKCHGTAADARCSKVVVGDLPRDGTANGSRVYFDIGASTSLAEEC
ncbi:hypothetical protein LSAT2_015153 [Lamellibrachia satsuma]|nr:hypothetical protein LSAT2_015153 [Lamellibrachia satsuma]